MLPPVVLAALVCCLSASASWRVPIHRVAPFCGTLLAAGAVILIWRRRGCRVRRAGLLLAGLATVAAWLALVDFSGRLWPDPSETISTHADAWSYHTLADYLERNERGRDSGMSLVDQFGGHMVNTRFASATLLAFLEEPPWPRDPVRVQWLFVTGCLLTHFFSMLALSRALLGGWVWPGVSAFIATAGGWLGDVIYCGNYDNLVFVALTPALLGVLCRLLAPGVGEPRFGAIIALAALLTASMMYCYPEGLALSGVLILPVLLALGWNTWRTGEPRRLLACVAALAAALLLAAPYLPTLVGFLSQQAGMGVANGPRPGSGVMPGLLGERFLPSLFALGEEINPSYNLANNLLPLVLLGLIGLGLTRVGRRFPGFPWVGLPLIGLLVWQDAVARYDYGTYKVILCATWWVYPTVVAGLAVLAERTAGRFRWAGAALTAALLLGIGGEKFEDRRARPALPPVSLQPLRELPGIRFVTRGEPTLLALDDDFDSLWALFYLRDLPVNVAEPRSYLAMPHIAPWLARASAPSVSDCRFVLRSGSRPGALWQNARFSLVRRVPAEILAVEGPNGVEQVEGRPWVWLGTRPTTLRILTATAGPHQLLAGRFVPGPSGPAEPVRALVVADSGGRRTVSVNAATRAVPLQLNAGENLVQLRCLDTPNGAVQANGDTRELMLAIHDFSVVMEPPAPTPP